MVIMAIAEAMWEHRADLLIEAVGRQLTESTGREPSDGEILEVLENRYALRVRAGGNYEIGRDGTKAEIARLIAVLKLEREQRGSERDHECLEEVVAGEVRLAWELPVGSGHLLLAGEPGSSVRVREENIEALVRRGRDGEVHAVIVSRGYKSEQADSEE